MKHFNGVVYHGSNAVFDKFDDKKARLANDFYGGGIAYFTDSKSVGESYARTMTKKYSGLSTLYEVKLTITQLFDVDADFTGQNLLNLLPNDVETFARSAGLLNFGSNKYKVLLDLKKGNITLTGNQIFKGLSAGQKNTAVTRDFLIKNKYDGLRYNGGQNMGMATTHNVYLAYYAKQIKIDQITHLVK